MALPIDVETNAQWTRATYVGVVGNKPMIYCKTRMNLCSHKSFMKLLLERAPLLAFILWDLRMESLQFSFLRKKLQNSTGKYSILVHHGGAGTTAAGLKAACPTTIVPFFGDQPFWGERVHARGLGPPPIPVDQFSLPKLVDSIKLMMDPQVKERAVELAKAMESEDGVTGAVRAFFKHLSRNSPHEPAPQSPSILSALGPFKKCFCA